MKTEDLACHGLSALGVVGVAAGVAVARDPRLLRRTARGLAQGIERGTLMAARAREHVGDLCAEAREGALAEVDAADFKRAGARAARAAAAAAPLKAARMRTIRPLKPGAPL